MTKHPSSNYPGQQEPSGDGSESKHGFFYWQLPAAEETRLRADNGILEEEGYLAHDINWGRVLLDTHADPTSVPHVNRVWAGPPTPDHVSDALSAILQVAVEMGMEPEVVCDRALATHRAVRKFAATAVRRERRD